MNKSMVCTATIWLLISTVSFAQKKILSLEEVWNKTLQQYPSLDSKRNLVEQQEFKKQLVRKTFLPEVNMQAQHSYGSYQAAPGSFFPLAGLYNSAGLTKDGGSATTGFNLNASAVMQWNFFQFGRLHKSLDLAESGIRSGKSAYSAEVFKLKATATRYYFAALQQAGLVNTYRADASRLATLLDLQRSQAQAGLRPGADTLLIKSAFLQAKTKINDQQQLLESSLLQIAALTGEEVDGFSLDTTLYRRLPAGDKFIEESYLNHPFLEYLDAVTNESKAALALIRKEPYPSVGLLAGTGIRGSGVNGAGSINNNIGAPWNNSSGTYLAGISITWNLSSLYQNKTKQHIQERQIASAKSEYQVAQLQFRTQLATAIAGWKQQREKLVDAKLALDASREAYELYTVRYESGLINLIELLQLQKSLQDAEMSYVTAIGSYWTELIAQSEALGNPDFLLNAIHP